MDAYSDTEILFRDYFTDDVEPVLRYASLKKQAIEEKPEPVQRHVIAREGNDDNKD